MTDLEQTTDSGTDLEKVDLVEQMRQEAAIARENITMEDVRLPGLVLQQAGSAGDFAAGKLVHNLTSEEFDSVDVLVFKMFKDRRLWGKNLGDPPRCTSQDAIGGEGDAGGSDPPKLSDDRWDCSRCTMAQRHEDPNKEGRLVIPCRLRYNYLAILLGDGRDIDHELPVGVVMHGVSINKSAKKLNSMLMGMEYPWAYRFVLGSEKLENEYGRFFAWTVTRGERATDDEMVAAFKFSKRLRAATVTVEGADEAPSAGGPAKDGDPDSDIPF